MYAYPWSQTYETGTTCGSPFRDAVAKRHISLVSRYAISCELSFGLLAEFTVLLGIPLILGGFYYLSPTKRVPANEEKYPKVDSGNAQRSKRDICNSIGGGDEDFRCAESYAAKVQCTVRVQNPLHKQISEVI